MGRRISIPGREKKRREKHGATIMTFKMRTVIFSACFTLLAANAVAATWTYVRIPHMATGNGYTSYLTVGDAQGTTSRKFEIFMYRDDGSPLYASVNGAADAASFSFTLPPLGEESFVLTSNFSLVGWIKIAGEGIGDINASLRFSYAGAAGQVADAVGILPTEANRSWSISVEKRKPGEYVGVAIVNPLGKRITVTVDLFQDGQRIPAALTYSKTIEPQGHWAVFVHQIFPGPYDNLSGTATLRVASVSDAFCAVALRADGSQYSSLPADPGAQTWTWSYTDATKVVHTGTWSWRLSDGASFVGYEQTAENPDNVSRIRGILDPGYFVAEYYWSNGTIPQGVVFYQGIPAKEGTGDIITGNRVTLNRDGIVVDTVSFKATRQF